MELINELRPEAILLNSLSFRLSFVVYAIAMLKRIPLWYRCDTNETAFTRSRAKHLLRSVYYRLVYSGISQAFPVGELNRKHLLRHGMRLSRLRDALHCTPDRAGVLSIQDRQLRRQLLRESLGLAPEQLLVSFFGKLIDKKDPLLLLQAVPYLSPQIRQHLSLLYVGSGGLQQELQSRAHELKVSYGVQVNFPGFVNQTALIDWYLATDVLVLPSRRAGETWGLVVNEAMQAGSGVVASEAVGCAADFGEWERFRTIPVGSAQHLALALQQLAAYPRNFDWAAEGLKNYSIEAAAQSFAAAITELV